MASDPREAEGPAALRPAYGTRRRTEDPSRRSDSPSGDGGTLPLRTDAILTARAIRQGVLTDEEARRVADAALDDMDGGATVRDRMAAARVLVALRGQDIRQAHYQRQDDRGDQQDRLAALRALLADPARAEALAALASPVPPTTSGEQPPAQQPPAPQAMPPGERE